MTDVALRFGYTNWRGETSVRNVKMISIRYGASQYHKREGWLMLGLDLDKNEQREFSMRDMILVEPTEPIIFAAQPEAFTGCQLRGPGECQSRGMCLSDACKHTGKTIRPRYMAEPREDGILYTKENEK